MPGYDYESVRKDPAKQQEILNFCAAFRQFLEDNDRSKQENGFSRQDKEPFWEVLEDLEETMQGGTVEHEITFDEKKNVGPIILDFDMMLDFMRGRLVQLDNGSPEMFQKMKQSISGADRFLEQIGMPERGPAGDVFDRSRDFLMYTALYHGNGQQRQMDGQAGQIHIATAYALREATKGAKDWRKVPVTDEYMDQRRVEIDHDLDGTGTISDMLTQIDKGAGNLCSPVICAEPEDLTDTINERYCSEVLPGAVKDVQQDYAKYLGKADVELNGNNVVEIAMPTMIKAGLAAGDPKKYKTFQDLDKEERKYRQLYESFYQNTKDEDLTKLLTGDPARVLKAVREYAPPAKDRIEELQKALKTEKDMAQKLRITAEIMANRELAGVKRGGKGLENRPDPAAVAERAEELAAEMAKVYKKDSKTMNNLVAQATSGHGGKMMEAYEKAAQPTREAAKPITYLDYIDKLDLEKASGADVAKLAAATAMYVREKEGARALTTAQEVDRIAEQIRGTTAFQEIMKNPQVLQNAKMGFGLPILEQLQKQEQVEQAERDREQAERDQATIEDNSYNLEWRKNMDATFLVQLKHQAEYRLFNDERLQNAQEYLEQSPGCRAEAMEIIEQYHIKGLRVPKLCEMPDEQLNDPEKHKAALERQRAQEKQKVRPEPQKQNDAPQIGMMKN